MAMLHAGDDEDNNDSDNENQNDGGDGVRWHREDPQQ